MAKENNPLRILVWLSIVLGLFFIAIVMSYNIAFDKGKSSVQTLDDSSHQILKLKNINKDSQNRVKALQNKVARLESLNKIEGHVHDKTKNVLKDIYSKNIKLNEELLFYRTLFTPQNIRVGLHIKDIELEEGSEAGVYNLSLVLIQIHDVKSKKRTIKGKVELTVYGHLKNGKRKKLTMAELQVKDPLNWSFSMKYFKKLRKKFILPDGFKADRITIGISPVFASTNNFKKINKSTTWLLKNKSKSKVLN